MRRASITGQLIAGVLLAELLCAAILAWTAIAHETHSRRRGFNVMLRGRADSLMGAVQDAEDPQDNVAVDPSELVLPGQDVYEVINPDGRVLGHSPASSPDLLAALRASGRDGFFNFKFSGTHYGAVRFIGVRVIDREENGGYRRPVTVLYASPTRDLWRESVEAVQYYVGSGIILLAVTGLALVWFLRYRLSPLQELATIAGRVSTRSWDFQPPDAVLRTTELAPIALSIQELVLGLRQSFERQRQLTGDAAHELKTSVAVLKSSLQLLSMNPRTTEQYEAGLDGLLLDTSRMEDLTSRMLALARLEESPADPKQSADLAAAARSVTEQMQALAKLKQVSLQVSTAGACNIALPSSDAETLCSNLMINALQHSPPGASVFVSVSALAGIAELRVMDNGEGIPESALPHVFDRFYRADPSRSRTAGGVGLGLSICKAVVERANGSIRIESSLGTGTQVIATLPFTSSAECK